MRRTVAISLAVVMCGCSSVRTVEVPVYVRDTAYVSREVHDSTYIDRWHTVEVMGDTVRWTDSVTVVRYVIVHDTIIKYEEVPVKMVETEEVERELTTWQRFKMRGFWWLSVGMVGYVLWRTRRLWGALIKF